MEEDQQQCIFCNIASGKIPAKMVYEDDKVAAVLDINPATPGHLLIVPKEHVAIMPQMSDELSAHVGMISKQLSHALIRALKVEGTTIFVANGVAAGQRAPHFLLHVIPRSKDDNIGLELPVVKIADQAGKEIFDKLAPAVAKQFGIEVAEKSKEELPKELEEKEEPSEEPKELKNEEPKEKSEKIPKKTPCSSKLDDITNFLTGGK